MQRALDRKFGGKVRNVFELLHLENEVIHDPLKLLCQVVCNRSVRQLVGNDSI
jgi:hypothetical protein